MEITNDLFKFTKKNYEKKFKSPIQQSLLIFKKRNMFTPTQNPIMLKTANNGPFYHFNWSYENFTNLPNPITHLIVISLKKTKGKNIDH
jgi:hypothetical protein